MSGLLSNRLGDCMSCDARKVTCVWVMHPPFWRHCLPCHEQWETQW